VTVVSSGEASLSSAGDVYEETNRLIGALRSDIARLHPFQDPAIVDRWCAHLEQAGLD
jgi:hypothetical protein